MVNLQDTPSAGPLTAADVAEARRLNAGAVLYLHRAEPWPCEWESCTGAACTHDHRECMRPAEACTDLGTDTTPGALSMARHRSIAGAVVLALIAAPAVAAIVAVVAFAAQH